MRKLFTFIAAALLSTGLWASTVDDLATISADHTVYFADITTAAFVKETLYDSNHLLSVNGNNYATNKGTDATIEKLYCIRVKNTTQDVLAFKTGSQCTLVLYADRATDRTPVLNTTISTSNAISGTVTPTNSPKGYVTYAIPAAGTYYIIGSGDCFLAGLEFSNFCTNPESSIIADQNGFVGDEIDLKFTSLNTSEVVWNISPNAGATVTAGKFTATAAGTYVVTATQVKDAPYCAVEESVTLTISAKTPVTSFEVTGPTAARVGEEITLTATNFVGGTPTHVWWTDKYGTTLVSTADYTFTPEAEGTIELTAWAENDFNTNPATVAHNVTVTIGHDATLSALSVGKDLTPEFNPAVTSYSVGQLKVYELLNVTATPNDAPYATAAAVDNKEDKVTVTVTADDKTTKQNYEINYTRAAATELVTVNDSTTWDWAKAGNKTAQLDDNTLPTKTEEFNFADVLSGQDASFKAASIAGVGQYANNDYAQLNSLKFHAGKAGTIIVEFSNTGSSDRPDRVLLVNNVQTTYKSKTSASHVTTDKISVAAGDVVIEALEMKETPAKNMIRIYLLTYVPDVAAAIDNTNAGEKAVKMIENGQLVIKRDGKTFNVLGTVVK